MNSCGIIFYGGMESPIGRLTIFASAKGICALQFGDQDQALMNVKTKLAKFSSKLDFVCDERKVEEAMIQLKEYFSGIRKTFDLPLDLHGTPFQLKVWEELSGIAYGKTVSYKDVAAAIGMPKAVRAVGGANNRNPVPIIIPCHRVIGTNGSLVGYGGGLQKKEYLLHLEKSPYRRLTS
ncbi:[Fe-S]-binding protein [Pueribacillus theae]|uniref:Methylated-DNA--protein-cysteine methyltransferase n=1 Tax=Pueribacillus theae TaxID=2171751 RepID=A0A2U1K0N0_9BACI|nr:methylated-DNA--[protein]-cysteine S-methyltransferase [Pueribacillus theae]PWA11047.1 [Fe-S]-binding protein [Pueribacillus theae]